MDLIERLKQNYEAGAGEIARVESNSGTHLGRLFLAAKLVPNLNVPVFFNGSPGDKITTLDEKQVEAARIYCRQRGVSFEKLAEYNARNTRNVFPLLILKPERLDEILASNRVEVYEVLTDEARQAYIKRLDKEFGTDSEALLKILLSTGTVMLEDVVNCIAPKRDVVSNLLARIYESDAITVEDQPLEQQVALKLSTAVGTKGRLEVSLKPSEPKIIVRLNDKLNLQGLEKYLCVLREGKSVVADDEIVVHQGGILYEINPHHYSGGPRVVVSLPYELLMEQQLVVRRNLNSVLNAMLGLPKLIDAVSGKEGTFVKFPGKVGSDSAEEEAIQIYGEDAAATLAKVVQTSLTPQALRFEEHRGWFGSRFIGQYPFYHSAANVKTYGSHLGGTVETEVSLHLFPTKFVAGVLERELSEKRTNASDSVTPPDLSKYILTGPAPGTSFLSPFSARAGYNNSSIIFTFKNPVKEPEDIGRAVAQAFFSADRTAKQMFGLI